MFEDGVGGLWFQCSGLDKAGVGSKSLLLGVSVRKFSEYPEPESTLLSSVGDDGVPCGG